MPILREKSANLSANIYIQLLSVIQSMALGCFAYNISPEKIFTNTNYALQGILILQVIVMVWHEYAIGAITYDWPIGYLDAWIPISLGLSQYLLILNLEKEFSSFSWSIGFFAAIALAAFLNQHFKSAAYEKNKKIIDLLKRHRIINLWQTLVFFILFSAFAIVAPAISEVHWRRLLLVILNLCLIIHQVRGSMSTRFLFHDVEKKD